jgi:glycosyltransferase involved in cell wall biosynthesis
VPYDERQNFLLEADVGVSTHYQHLETTFAFRTRILDYLCAPLPIVTTRGDSFASLVEAGSLGVSVEQRDVDGLADALERILYGDDYRCWCCLPSRVASCTSPRPSGFSGRTRTMSSRTVMPAPSRPGRRSPV